LKERSKELLSVSGGGEFADSGSVRRAICKSFLVPAALEFDA
jgi:hypothetical protein